MLPMLKASAQGPMTEDSRMTQAESLGPVPCPALSPEAEA